ncbi:ABC transporter permease [Bordetella genomosp. 9]|uniref:ABC transporter permease n=1 Tax=Bordetella genomosp. 9 TaxID=1416803 RepID=UPI0018DF727A|nr:ABC transporter permease [Bordetella genomosp. 9]
MMRSFLIAILALASHWRRHRLQCVSILSGLWLATALWSGVQALNAQARADYARASAVLAGADAAQWLPRTGEWLEQDVYVALRRAGWQVSPVVEGRLRFPGDPPVALRVLGIEPLSLPPDSVVAGRRAAAFDLGAFIGEPGQAWAGPDTLARLGLMDGDTPVTVDGDRLPPLRLQPQLAPGVIVMDIGHAQRLLHAAGKISRLLLAQAGARTPDGTATPGGHEGDPGAVEPPAQWAGRLKAAPPADRADLDRLTRSFHLNLTAMGLLAFIVGLFIVHASIGLALEQRRPLLRTLRACGVSLRVLVAALGAELTAFALAGGLAGVATGYLLAGALLGNVAASLRGLYGAEVASHLALPPSWWLAGIAMTLAGMLAAGGASLWRAARLPLLALARPQAWRGAQAAALRRRVWAAGALAIVAAACGVAGNSLASAFTMQAAILLAAALLLPALLDGALAWAARHAGGPLAAWFVADSRQQLPALSLALMALLLALAASVGVGSMTEGFRATFLGWLDQRLSADLYATPHDSAQGETAAAWLRERRDVHAVLPQWRADTRIQGWPLELQGVENHAETRRQWPLLSHTGEAWARVAQGEGVMISEQLARRLGLALGARLALPAENGGTRAYAIVGLYADYGNPKGHVLMDAAALRRDWPSASLRSLHVYAVAGQAAHVRAALARRFETAGMQIVDQAGIKQWSRQVFERTFAATGALNGLTLGVAGVALFIGLLTLSHSRLAQLAPLWALGVQRSRLAWLALGQVSMLSAMTVLFAIPLGILVAWCLVAVVNVQAFGWRLPLHIFPMQLVRLAALGLMTSLLAAAWPVWQLRRRQPAELLRQFAGDA